eukprot:CAMPEP_0197593422 /NCGR_PEP_ID=MMETSP1326-20131121/18111_1 /TAXON_ID=1155430 /ORGANISM="Genus nov. species nov., Strain RCC2288" /LENGTH=41 /DNA_ID= /DNA_START= /DNA_END= /DNA_ORIENTATION=
MSSSFGSRRGEEQASEDEDEDEGDGESGDDDTSEFMSVTSP